MFHPVSTPLQSGLRFLRHLLPAASTVRLAAHLPFPATRRAYPVSHEFQNVSDPTSTPAASHPRWTTTNGPYLAAYLLVQACQHLGLVVANGVQSVVHICWSSSLVPSPSPPRCWQIRPSLTGWSSDNIGGYIVPRASHGAVTGAACPGREQ